VLRLLVIAITLSSLPILVNLMMEVIISSGTSNLSRAARRNVRDNGILYFSPNQNRTHGRSRELATPQLLCEVWVHKFVKYKQKLGLKNFC
jgi:hypothetical protein